MPDVTLFRVTVCYSYTVCPDQNSLDFNLWWAEEGGWRRDQSIDRSVDWSIGREKEEEGREVEW